MMFVRTQSAKNIQNSVLNSTATSQNAQYETDTEMETVICSLIKLTQNLHLVKHKTLQRLEAVILSLHTQFQQRTAMKKQFGTPHLHQAVKLDTKQHPFSNENPRVTCLEVEIQMQKLQKLKSELQEENARKLNLHRLGLIQSKYIDRRQILPIHAHMNSLLKEMQMRVEKPGNTCALLPLIEQVYKQILRDQRSRARIYGSLTRHCSDIQHVLSGSDDEAS